MPKCHPPGNSGRIKALRDHGSQKLPEISEIHVIFCRNPGGKCGRLSISL